MASAPLDEEAIFKVACKIASPEARAEYLRQACGNDPGLGDRVAALLRVHDEEPSFLEPPTPDAAAIIESPNIRATEPMRWDARPRSGTPMASKGEKLGGSAEQSPEEVQILVNTQSVNCVSSRLAGWEHFRGCHSQQHHRISVGTRLVEGPLSHRYSGIGVCD